MVDPTATPAAVEAICPNKPGPCWVCCWTGRAAVDGWADGYDGAAAVWADLDCVLAAGALLLCLAMVMKSDGDVLYINFVGGARNHLEVLMSAGTCTSPRGMTQDPPSVPCLLLYVLVRRYGNISWWMDSTGPMSHQLMSGDKCFCQEPQGAPVPLAGSEPNRTVRAVRVHATGGLSDASAAITLSSPTVFCFRGCI